MTATATTTLAKGACQRTPPLTYDARSFGRHAATDLAVRHVEREHVQVVALDDAEAYGVVDNADDLVIHCGMVRARACGGAGRGGACERALSAEAAAPRCGGGLDDARRRSGSLASSSASSTRVTTRLKTWGSPVGCTSREAALNLWAADGPRGVGGGGREF